MKTSTSLVILPVSDESAVAWELLSIDPVTQGKDVGLGTYMCAWIFVNSIIGVDISI
jgi:hypothetical protein